MLCDDVERHKTTKAHSDPIENVCFHVTTMLFFCGLCFTATKPNLLCPLLKIRLTSVTLRDLLEINKLKEHRDSGLFQPSVFYSTGHRLRHCPIPRLLLLLHHPAGPALPVLFCGPASGGKKHLGKGRQKRMYPTSVKKRQLRSSAHERKCLSSYLVVFKSCCHDTFPFWR